MTSKFVWLMIFNQIDFTVAGLRMRVRVEISYDFYFWSASSLPLANCHLELFFDKVDIRNFSSIMVSFETPFRHIVRPSRPATQTCPSWRPIFGFLCFGPKSKLLYFLSLLKKNKRNRIERHKKDLWS